MLYFVLQVSQKGKTLLDVLQRPQPPADSGSLTAGADYSQAVRGVLEVVHEVVHQYRRLEGLLQHRKLRLHQRLQLCVFQQDVQQVYHTYVHDNTQMHTCTIQITQICMQHTNIHYTHIIHHLTNLTLNSQPFSSCF